MEIICSTAYDRRALFALARALREAVHRIRSRLLRVWYWALPVPSLLSTRVSWGEWGTMTLNGMMAVLMLAVLLGGGTINVFSARRNTLPGMEVCTMHFLGEHYETKVAGTATQWRYSELLRLAESDRYLVFILRKNHNQFCDKEGVTNATLEELHAFLKKKTGPTVERFRQRGPPLRHRGNLFVLGIREICGVQK